MGTASMRNNTYLVISGLCAVATVFLGVVQTFGLVPGIGGSTPTPAATIANSPGQQATTAPANELTVAKLEANTPLDETSTPLRFGRGTRDGVVDRYAISDIFDGNPLTYIETAPGDRDLDFIAEFASAPPMKITGLEYRHPASAGSEAVATQVDVIVLPEGELGGAGRQVSSFSIAPEKGPQRFPIPPAVGKGVWLRVAGEPNGGDLQIGDFRLLTSNRP